MNRSNYKEALTNPAFSVISDVSEELGVDSYVIGGFVRDVMLGKKAPKDIDIVAVGSGIELARRVADALDGKPDVAVFKNFGTAMLRHGKLEIEFVGARKESYNRDSRKPVVESTVANNTTLQGRVGDLRLAGRRFDKKQRVTDETS